MSIGIKLIPGGQDEPTALTLRVLLIYIYIYSELYILLSVYTPIIPQKHSIVKYYFDK